MQLFSQQLRLDTWRNIDVDTESSEIFCVVCSGLFENPMVFFMYRILFTIGKSLEIIVHGKKDHVEAIMI